MKEILVLSGKGGTGKTTVSLSLVKRFSSKITADTDVDAADMFIILEPDVKWRETFYSNGNAVIDYNKCNSCGLCMKSCRFNAISLNNVKKRIEIDESGCEGCGLCFHICPKGAVEIKETAAGEFFVSETGQGSFVHARLKPGADNSGRLVEKVKSRAKKEAETEGVDYIISDGPPGIGCPVISSVSGVDYAVIVTEPTLSGMHDLKRIKKLLDHFGVKHGVVINKADINPRIVSEIEKLCAEISVEVLEKINYSKCITDAMNKKKFACDECPEFSAKMDSIYKKTVEMTAN